MYRIFKYHCTKGNIQLAELLFNHLKASSPLSLSTTAYVYMIELCLLYHNIERAKYYLSNASHEITSKSESTFFRMNGLVLYTPFIDYFTRERNLEGCGWVLEALKRLNIQADLKVLSDFMEVGLNCNVSNMNGDKDIGLLAGLKSENKMEFKDEINDRDLNSTAMNEIPEDMKREHVPSETKQTWMDVKHLRNYYSSRRIITTVICFPGLEYSILKQHPIDLKLDFKQGFT